MIFSLPCWDCECERRYLEHAAKEDGRSRCNSIRTETLRQTREQEGRRGIWTMCREMAQVWADIMVGRGLQGRRACSCTMLYVLCPIILYLQVKLLTLEQALNSSWRFFNICGPMPRYVHWLSRFLHLLVRLISNTFPCLCFSSDLFSCHILSCLWCTSLTDEGMHNLNPTATWLGWQLSLFSLFKTWSDHVSFKQTSWVEKPTAW